MSATPDLARGLWRGFTVDHDEADAARRFEQRYGQPPEYIVEDRGVLWVGPIPEGAEPRQRLVENALQKVSHERDR